jgi:hypothetical protein
MMSNLEVQIKPSGISQRNEVDCFYAVVSSILGGCKKLDDDGGVPSETYEANVFTAIFNGSITNSRGETVMNALSGKEDSFFTMSPMGITPKAELNCICQIFDMMETWTEQLDGDSLTDTDYEALVYTAHFLWRVKDERGNTFGASTAQTISPMGMDNAVRVDVLYTFVHSLDTLYQKLDDDGTVTDTDYEALWDTANILMQVQDGKGNVAGNALTQFNP